MSSRLWASSSRRCLRMDDNLREWSNCQTYIQSGIWSHKISCLPLVEKVIEPIWHEYDVIDDLNQNHLNPSISLSYFWDVISYHTKNELTTWPESSKSSKSMHSVYLTGGCIPGCSSSKIVTRLPANCHMLSPSWLLAVASSSSSSCTHFLMACL